MRRRLLTVGEAARRLHLSVDKVRQLADDGELRAQRTEGGHRRFTEEAIERYLARETSAPRRRQPAGSKFKAKTPARARTRAHLDMDDEPPEVLDALEEWDDIEQVQPMPMRPPPARPAAPAIRPTLTMLAAGSVTPTRDEAKERAAQAQREAQEEAQRLQRLKNYGLGEIPYDLPAAWRAKVVEELESYVTTARLPAWVSASEQRNLVSGRVQAIVKAYRDHVEQEERRQRAEEERKQAAAKAKAEAERRVATLISHGATYAEEELSDFDVFDQWEIRDDVQKVLGEEVRADWSERDVEALVDDVIDEYEDED